MSRALRPAPRRHGARRVRALASAPLERATSGLINPTWFVHARDGTRLVLQRVNPIFPVDVNVDIEVVTRHLFAKGVETPTLVPSRFGKRWLEHDGLDLARAHENRRRNSRRARSRRLKRGEAGRVLGEFHRAVSDLKHQFRSRRLGVHDTARHLQGLRGRARASTRGHRDFANVRTLGEQVLALAAELPALPPMPDRIVHGDPKISNVMFAEHADRALCLIDLDTLRADADRARARRRAALVVQPRDGRRARGELRARVLCGRDRRLRERRARAAATRGVGRDRGRHAHEFTVELAARFCADALRER